MPEAAVTFTDTDRQLLKSVMSLVIPSVEELPGAGDMDLVPSAEELANRKPVYGIALRRILDALYLDPSPRAEGGFAALDEDQQIEALKFLEANMPRYFDKFIDLIYIVYYSDSRVHERIGWRNGPLQPMGWEMPQFDPSILETVSKREPFWRKV